MKVKQRFSLRKEKIGVVSVLIGLGFFGAAVGASSVVQAADEASAPVVSEDSSVQDVTSEDVKNSKEAADKAAQDVKDQEAAVATAGEEVKTKESSVNDADKAIADYKKENNIAADRDMK